MAIKTTHTTTDGTTFNRIEDARYHESLFQSFSKLVTADELLRGGSLALIIQFMMDNRVQIATALNQAAKAKEEK
jgi:hypothetical protein